MQNKTWGVGDLEPILDSEYVGPWAHNHRERVSALLYLNARDYTRPQTPLSTLDHPARKMPLNDNPRFHSPDRDRLKDKIFLKWRSVKLSGFELVRFIMRGSKT